VDETGVGRAIVDLLRQAQPPAFLNAVLVTTGHQTGYEGGRWHVPRAELAATLQALLQSRQLQVAAISERELLVQELLAFRVRVTTAAAETFEAWTERPHDDLVLAVALAAWLGEKRGRACAPYFAPPVKRDWYGRRLDDWEQGNVWRECDESDCYESNAARRGLYGL
jgi:hypothetical protein